MSNVTLCRWNNIYRKLTTFCPPQVPIRTNVRDQESCKTEVTQVRRQKDGSRRKGACCQDRHPEFDM